MDLNVGPTRLVDIVLAADKIRSGSIRILGKLGAIEAKMLTTSSDLGTDLEVVEFDRSSLSELFSAKPAGLVVKIAASRRRKRS